MAAVHNCTVGISETFGEVVRNLACKQRCSAKILSDHVINQSSSQFHFYSANIPGKARLSGATAKSVFDNEIHEAVHDVNVSLGIPVFMGTNLLTIDFCS